MVCRCPPGSHHGAWYSAALSFAPIPSGYFLEKGFSDILEKTRNPKLEILNPIKSEESKF
jgi:hypothetical protein